MIPTAETLPRKSRLTALLEHFAVVEDPRDVRRITHRLDEILLLVVCGTIADCDDYEDIAAWGAAHLDFLRRHLPYADGVPGERWLTILMNRIDPDLFASAFAGWVRESWPDKAALVAIDGKTSRRSHDKGAGTAPLHLVSAFATTARLVLAQEAVPDKANELAAIPLLLERLGAEGGLKGALVSIDAIATNGEVAAAILAQGADYLLAVKANQPTLRAEVEAAFAEAPAATLDTHADLDKGHGRLEERRMTVLRDTDWLDGGRRFPGEVRLPGAACLLRAETRVEARGATRSETRFFISSRALSAAEAATAVREHWAIENRLHWVLDVTFADDQSRLRRGHGARNMATVRHFALNLVRTATDKRSLKSRRKIAGWDPDYLEALIRSRP
ncbi:ISAs1 family transposase, partial [Amaricoccus sp.]|uniref:ISAs1 family transposase n=1 Tax=Amaricoccus sp. TaxID=1872485 RepID=UPI002601E807